MPSAIRVPSPGTRNCTRRLTRRRKQSAVGITIPKTVAARLRISHGSDQSGSVYPSPVSITPTSRSQPDPKAPPSPDLSLSRSPRGGHLRRIRQAAAAGVRLSCCGGRGAARVPEILSPHPHAIWHVLETGNFRVTHRQRKAESPLANAPPPPGEVTSRWSAPACAPSPVPREADGPDRRPAAGAARTACGGADAPRR